MQVRARILVFSAFVGLITGCDQGTAPVLYGAPARVLIVAGDNQAATVATELPLPLVVHVVDSTNRSVPDQAIYWVASGGGSVVAGSALTDESGVALARWTFGERSGEQSVEALVFDRRTGMSTVFATFRAQAMADRPAGILSSAVGRVGPVSTMLADTPWVAVLDRFRNPVPNAAVQWSVVTGGGSVTAITPSTNQQGIARAAWTLGPVIGTQFMKVTVAGLPDFGFSANAIPAR